MESVQAIKQRFGIIGNDPKLNRAIEKAIQVAPTDISVLDYRGKQFRLLKANNIKRILIVFLMIFIWSCNGDDDSDIVSQENPNIPANFDDADGDGVEFVQERRDNTNPNAPCDYLVESQIYEYTSTQWREGDCDGDGVTNGEEIDSNSNGQAGPVGTDPRDLCDYNANIQIYANTSSQWRNQDCDGDGVTNGDEIDPDGNGTNEGNGTNSQDWCSLDVAAQTVDPLPEWLAEDCDGDCQRNFEELANGTDLLDPESYNGNGENLVEIVTAIRSRFGEGLLKRVMINSQLNRVEMIYDGDGNVLSEFTYDNDNQLVEVVNWSPSFSRTTFTYENSQIIQVMEDFGQYTDIKDVAINGNEIFTYNSSIPGVPFHERFELDPNSGKVIFKEEYYGSSPNNLRYSPTEYTYDAIWNIRDRTSPVYDYDPGTGTITPTFDFYKEIFRYDQLGINNPAYDLLKDIYLNIILAESIISNLWRPIPYGLTSERFCNYAFFSNDALSRIWTAETGCVQDNGLMYKAYQNDSANYVHDIDYIYQ